MPASSCSYFRPNLCNCLWDPAKLNSRDMTQAGLSPARMRLSQPNSKSFKSFHPLDGATANAFGTLPYRDGVGSIDYRRIITLDFAVSSYSLELMCVFWWRIIQGWLLQFQTNRDIFEYICRNKIHTQLTYTFNERDNRQLDCYNFERWTNFHSTFP